MIIYSSGLISLAAAYALLAKIAIDFFSANGVVSIVWPCSGLALAALLVGGKKYWPGIFIGALAGNVMAGSSPAISAFIASGNTLEALTGFWLLAHNRRFDPALKYPQHYLALGIAGIFSACVGALIGNSTLLLSGFLKPGALASNLLNWWQGDMLGIILVTPLILVWRKPPYDWLKQDRVLETTACFGLSWLFGQIIFLGWFNDWLGPMPGSWMYLFFVWSAVRFGRHGVLLVMLITTSQDLLGLARHIGFFGATFAQTGLINFWFYTLVLSVVGMMLALIIYENNQAKQTLSLSEEKLRTMFEMSALGMARNAMDGRYIEANNALLDMVGYSLEELNRLTYWDLTPKEYEPQEALQLELLSATHRYGPYEKEYFHKDGRRIAIRLNGVLIDGSDGEKYIWSTIEDISERRQTEEAMRLAALVYQNSSEAMVVTDADDTILAINPAFTQLTGYTADEIVGKHPNIRSSGRQDEAFYREMRRDIEASGCWQGEIWNRRKSGEVCAEWLSINTIFNPDGSVHRRVALFYDITEKKASDDLIWQQANFDPLTGLPNRRMFHDRLDQDIRKAHRNNLLLALLFLDLDRFKEVNDSFGHGIGDQLLKEAAQRLNNSVREIDTVARLGGDEFTVILGELDDINKVESIAQRILAGLSKPFTLGNDIAYISASIGIAFYSENAVTGEELLRCADQAMYCAKNQGRNRYSFFNLAMQEAAQKRMRLATDLHTALAEQQFHVVYQPIIELATGIICKAEILLRWQHPLLGPVSPCEFIPIAEDTGLIIEIGEWVFQQASRQLKRWRTRYCPEFQVSINKSPVQFQDAESHYEAWSDQLKRLDLPGQSIVVEITEGMLLDTSSFINKQFLALRDTGIQVALDDFGTGYSSLSYLKKFDIDYLKIDQSFVRNLDAHSDDKVLCEAIIVMAHKLGIKVIAEGVETAQQRDLLTAMGCDYAQGYLFSKPVPAEEFELCLLPSQKGKCLSV
ncbi:MAG: EAL domain-containing protein [Methylovulum sp.]|nr:MAG: EAL domain-containing protein [Methylovulum sp.]